MRVEYNGVVAHTETVEEAAALIRLLTSSTNGHRQTIITPPAAPPANQQIDPPNIATAIRNLRDPQKAVFTAIIGNDGSAQGTVLMETLGITRQALGGLLAGIRKSLEAAGLNSEDVLRARETDRGREYFTPNRSRVGVREGLGME